MILRYLVKNKCHLSKRDIWAIPITMCYPNGLGEAKVYKIYCYMISLNRPALLRSGKRSKPIKDLFTPSVRFLVSFLPNLAPRCKYPSVIEAERIILVSTHITQCQKINTFPLKFNKGPFYIGQGGPRSNKSSTLEAHNRCEGDNEEEVLESCLGAAISHPASNVS